MVTIYLITNQKNGKKYVGQTKRTAVARYCQHIESAFRLSENKRNCFYREIVASGESALNIFKFEIIEKCEDDVKFERELYWIKKYNCEYNDQHKESYIRSCWEDIVEEYENGICMQDIYTKYHCRHDTIKQILLEHGVEVKRYKTIGVKKIYEFDDSGNLINEYRNTEDCSKETGISKLNIRYCARRNQNTNSIRYGSNSRKFSYSNQVPKDIVKISDSNGEYAFKTVESVKQFLKENSKEKALFGNLTRAYFYENRKTAYGYTILFIDDIAFRKQSNKHRDIQDL